MENSNQENLTEINLEEQVMEALELVRPALQMDGGDIEFRYIDDDNYVHVTLTGACGSCAISPMTLKGGVERVMRDRIPEIKGVIELTEEEPAKI
jgi:Fe-S cluster biogenesis protein NfuA